MLIDEAEAQDVPDRRGGAKAQQGFVRSIRCCTETVERIDMLYSRENKNDVIGLPTGFVDLDRMTSGLQPGELIIVAGRPSMGKTAARHEHRRARRHRHGKKPSRYSAWKCRARSSRCA